MSLATESEISIVYAAMGMVQSKFDIQESISWFFKRSLSLSYNSSYSIIFFLSTILLCIFSFQSKSVCIQSLFALCSIGLVKNDSKLIGAVFVELDKLIDNQKYRFDIFKLKAIHSCLKVRIFYLRLFHSSCSSKILPNNRKILSKPSASYQNICTRIRTMPNVG